MNLTPKQEAFCLAYIETGNASEAYRRAYDVGENTKPETINVKASELLAHGKVSVRVEELRAGHTKRHNITVDSLTGDLIEDRQSARNNDQTNVAVTATMGIAKIHGFDRVKLEHSGGVEISASPEWARVQGVILSALVPFPEAKRAVADALTTYEAGNEPSP